MDLKAFPPKTAAEIFAIVDRRIEPVDVPEWACRLYVRTMTARERTAWEAKVFERRDPAPGSDNGNSGGTPKSLDGLREDLLVRTVCDQEGTLIFQPGDIERLGDRNTAAVQRLFNASNRLNLVQEEDLKELGKA